MIPHSQSLIDLSYILASVLFIFGLKMLSRPHLARRGNLISAIGMLLAVVATLLMQGLSYPWIILGLLIGTAVGTVLAYRVTMTAMPQMVALLNGFGGLASLLVAWTEYLAHPNSPFSMTLSIYLATLIGGVTFTGSVIAYAKLDEKISGKPLLFPYQRWMNAGLLSLVLIGGEIFCQAPSQTYFVFLIIILLSLVLGVLSVIPIGGADMPVVISLLNSYSGLAACAAGFIIANQVLIVAGTLVGASGIILTNIMCKAMNRSLANVLFSGFGKGSTKKETVYRGEAKTLSPEDAYIMLEAAQSVVIVPGYGLAVSQAQHAVRELGELLQKNDCEVKYVIHPVAGRMPGHMNVLLAEANVPYEQLVEPDDVNPMISNVDVAIVIGANDVVNPAARENPGSIIYGMPIINVDQARIVFVLKRTLGAGFSGVDNPLFFRENTRMLLGDAKATVQTLINQFK